MRSEFVERLVLPFAPGAAAPLCVSCFEYVAEGEGQHRIYVGTTSGAILVYPCNQNPSTSSYTVQLAHHLLQPTFDAEIEAKGHETEVTCLIYKRSSKLMFSGSLDRTIKVWNIFRAVGTSPLVQTISGHSGSITSIIDGRPDDPSIYSLATDGTLKMWAPQQGREMFKNDFFQIVFSLPASSAIGYASADTTLWFSSAVVSVRGCWQLYAGMSDGSIYILRKTVEFDQNEEPTVKSLKVHERWDDIHDLRVSYLAMANNGTLLVSLSLDLVCKVMDPANGQTIFSMKNCRKCMYTGTIVRPQHFKNK
jgi:WD40 repeat protein